MRVMRTPQASLSREMSDQLGAWQCGEDGGSLGWRRQVPNYVEGWEIVSYEINADSGRAQAPQATPRTGARLQDHLQSHQLLLSLCRYFDLDLESPISMLERQHLNNAVGVFRLCYHSLV